MFIVNQDRDEIIQKTQPLCTCPVLHDGTIIAINLWYGEHLLGTFDSLSEVIAEMEQIEQCNDDVCFVSGYCNGEDDAELIEILLSEVLDNELAD